MSSMEGYEEDSEEKEETEGEEEFGEAVIPYEPEEPEEVLKFILSTIGLLIERVIPEKPRALSLRKAGNCLRCLGKIWNLSEYPPNNLAQTLIGEDAPEKKLMDMEGFVDEYQYLHIEAVDLGLTDVRILPQHFVWLLSADLSGNRLTNETACPVTKLPNLVALKLNRNRVEDPYLPPMKHLQYLGLNSNKIKSLHRIYHPNLETLDLNYNLIKEVNSEDCWKHTKLSQLELRGNQLRTTSGIEYSSLVNLYLAENRITELKGLEILVNLQRLHLRGNPLSELTGFTESNVNLKYLNVRKCQLDNVTDLKPLSVLGGLKELVVMGNRFNPEKEKHLKKDEEEEEEEEGEEEKNEQEGEEEDEELEKIEDLEGEGYEEDDDDGIRMQILSYIPTLTRIDKRTVTPAERRRMKELTENWTDI